MSKRLQIGSVVAGILIASASASAQVSRYYVTAGDNSTNTVLQGGLVVQQWPQANNIGNLGEYALAVSGDIRTLPNGNATSGLGSQYTLAGAYTGTTYTAPVPGAAFYDGATDGNYNYSIDYFNGDVWRMDRNWANPTQIFNAASQGDGLSITWDAFTNTLWTGNWSGSTISNWSMTGTLLSFFDAGVSSISSLGMDYADGTLWFGSQNRQGYFWNVSTAGQFLSLTNYSGMDTQNTLGGEFDVGGAITPTAAPEPASFVLLASGLIALVPIMRRRRKNSI